MDVIVKNRSLFFTYLKLGYLLHLMTIAELYIIVNCFQNYDLIEWMLRSYSVLKAIVLFLFVIAPIYPQCDARSRFQNYKQVKDHLYLYGFQSRLVKPFSFSRCQRDAVLAAAEELGMEKKCKDYFKLQGYYWYHILPDFLFHHPFYLFHKAFWLNTFFAKYYKSKIDFSTIGNTNAATRSRQFSMSAGSLSN